VPQTPQAANGSKTTPGKPTRRWKIPTGVSPADTNLRSTAVSTATSLPQPEQHTAPPLTTTTLSGPSVPQTEPAVSAPVTATAQMTAPAPTIRPVSGVISAALAWVGLSPSLTGGPVAPVESPAMLAMLAAWHRQSRKGVADEAPTELADLAQTSQIIEPTVPAMLNATGVQGDQQTPADTSTMQLSAPVSLALADTSPPTAVITAPAANAIVSGTLTVSATATDDVGVTGVQFLVNGGPLGVEDTTAAYSVSVPTTAANNGTYTLTARARDAAGNTTTSAPVTITIDNTAPTVSLTAPPSGPVSGTLTLAATAADNVGVAGVQFLVNGTVFAQDTTAAYSVSMPTTAANNGTYTLTARALDAAGNTTTSAPVTITIDNTAPTLSTTAESLFVNMDTNVADKVTVQLVRGNDGKNRLVVSMSGAHSQDPLSQADAMQGNAGVLNPVVGAYIDAACEYALPEEIMLVGFSGGGQEMQNYAATGTYKDFVTVVVLYGVPLTQTTSEIDAGSLLIVDRGDLAYELTTHSDADASYLANPDDQWSYYLVGEPSTEDTHSQETYLARAQEFDEFVQPLTQDVDFARIYSYMQRFGGTILESQFMRTRDEYN
jgi:hypothetical protein